MAGEIGWSNGDPESLGSSLREKGLDLALEVRAVDVIVIRRR